MRPSTCWSIRGVVRVLPFLLVAGCTPAGDNSDPLAYAGTRPDTSLEKILKDAGFVLPPDAVVVGWADESGIELDVLAEVSLPCRSVDQFVSASGLGAASTTYPTDNDWVGQQAGQHDQWHLNAFRDLRAWEDHVRDGNFYREVVAGRVKERRDTCGMFLTAFSV